MSIPRPIGARILVTDIAVTLSIEERARKAGIVAIVNEENRPKPTQGKIVAVGSDPFLHDLFTVGQVVSFNKWAGTQIIHEEIEYRSLELNEVITVVEGAP